MTETILAYAAGFIDGEGTISIWRQRRPQNRSGLRYRAVLEVYNSDLRVCDWFKTHFGGYIAQKSKEGPNQKAVFKWAANQSEVLALLLQLYPYLMLKKSQAEFVIHYTRLLPGPGKRAETLHPVYEDLCTQVQALNTRGLAIKEA